MEKIACGRAALMHLYSASSTCMGLVEQVLVSALAVVCFCFFVQDPSAAVQVPVRRQVERVRMRGNSAT